MASNPFDQFDANPFDEFDEDERMAALPQSMANIQADQASYSPAADMSGFQSAAAGAGKAIYDLGRGAGQLFGVVDRQDVADARALDAPLMQSGAAKAGNFAGNVAAAIPAAFVPGANTVAGAGVIGAGMGLLQPSVSNKETALNLGLGLAGGAGGQKFGQWVAPKLSNAISQRAVTAAENKAANAVRDQTLAEARKVGYKVPPAAVNQESAIARGVESLAGKQAMMQTAAVTNQKVTNNLVREEFGLSRGARLSIETLNGIRKKASEPYKAIKATGEVVTDQNYLDDLTNLSKSADELKTDFPDLDIAGSKEIQSLQNGLLRERFSANGALEVIKELRHSASKNLAWNVDDPAKKALGMAQREAAGIVEEQVIRHLNAQGKGALAAAFDKGRQTIAKTYSVQSALNEGSGNVVASKLSAQLRKGKPLSGNLEKIARFASSVEGGVVKEQVGSPGVSALIAGASMGGGGAGIAMGEPTLAAVMAGLPLAREGVRRTLLTKAGQRIAAPSYSPNNSLLKMMRGVAPLSAPIGIGIANAEQ
jgi:hypothetical protein